ncbi:MAG: HprK-related kinase A [Geminicoccaceae bacterium]|nr:HprK-related kinase A [Geminicoccaceae bacterium]
MRLEERGARWCRDALAGDGLNLRLGPFRVRASSPIASLGDELYELYAAHEILDTDETCDFDIALSTKGGIRRFWRPQVTFTSDGTPPFYPLPLEQAAAFFEWGLNWCIASHGHDHLVIHAAVLAKDERALVMPAPSGAGKSTLTAALAFSGWRLLSDELALIDLESGAVRPLARPINLKNRSIDIIGERFPHLSFTGVAEGTVKGKVGLLRPPDDSVHRMRQEARVNWIVLPRYLAGNPVRFSPLSPPRALMQLAENAMNYSIHGRRGFDLLCSLVDKARSFTLLYSNLDDALQVLDDMTDGRFA